MKSRIALVVALGALAAAAPAGATPKEFFFNCTGAAPLQTINVNAYTWSDTAPAKSYQEGAGCGWLDPGALAGTAQPNPLYDAAFGGNYAGEVRQIDLTLYAPAFSPLTSDKTIDVVITSKGTQVYALDGIGATAEPGPDAAINKYTFTIPEIEGIDAGTTRRRSSSRSPTTTPTTSAAGWRAPRRSRPACGCTRSRT